ncbi:MAG: nucleotide exchange factor GrpE [Acidobacteriota bacterium]|nr:nucleotide exchange factor GrpE [Acidobacteriota bacterium]
MAEDRSEPFDEVLEPATDDRNADGVDAAPSPTERPEDAAASLEGNAAQAAAERDAFRDQLLRARADFDNYRKRVERDRAQMIARASEDALRDILPVVDDLERALAADPGEASGSFHQGVQMIYKQMLDVLARRGLEPIEAIGQDFDPNIHEAVAYEPAAGRREGEIIGELRKGYRIGDRLVRPSMVRVAQEVH